MLAASRVARWASAASARGKALDARADDAAIGERRPDVDAEAVGDGGLHLAAAAAASVEPESVSCFASMRPALISDIGAGERAETCTMWPPRAAASMFCASDVAADDVDDAVGALAAGDRQRAGDEVLAWCGR